MKRIKSNKNKKIQALNRYIEAKIKAMIPDLVKEEVENQLKLILESSNPQPNMMNESGIDTPMKHPNQSNGTDIRTGNSVLDNILKSTKGGIMHDAAPGSTIQESYDNLMGKDVFTSNDMNSLPSVQQQNKSVNNIAGHSGRRIDSNSAVGTAIEKAMNRDYTELVKRFNK
jgi:hypothetical protein